MNRIDILAYKMYSYDTDAFIRDVLNYSKNSIIVVFDFDKIIIHHKPSNIEFKKDTIYYPSKRNLYFKLLWYPIYLWQLTKLLFAICWKYRPRICWIENTDAAVIVGILRRLHLCAKSIYLPGDWVAGYRNKKDILGYIFKNIIFPVHDYLACKLNDMVLDHTKEIAEARYRFWNKEITKKHGLYGYKPQVRSVPANSGGDKRFLCFLGDIRKDSGLDIVIFALSEVRKKYDIALKVIGPENYERYEYLKKLAAELGVAQHVDFLGFVKTDKLAEVLSDCFCGINLLTSVDSYSSYTIPGKFIHYLQFLLPVLTTKGGGPFVSQIQEKGLGIVIEPHKDKVVGAIIDIYREQNSYRGNIIQYINSQPTMSIREFVES